MAFAPLVLTAAAAVLPAAWWAVRALLVVLLVVPWMPLFVSARNPGG
ncbi:MAG: hypothetical protein ACR2GH_19210 [Pseudonocardia sp.]